MFVVWAVPVVPLAPVGLTALEPRKSTLPVTKPMSLTETLSRISNTFVTDIGAAATPPEAAHNATQAVTAARSGARRRDGGQVPVSRTELMRASIQARAGTERDSRANAPNAKRVSLGCQG